MNAALCSTSTSTEDDAEAALAARRPRGADRKPKWLPPKWFYDERGSALFDEITRLPEYYPTRAEREILVAQAAEIGPRPGSARLVELGRDRRRRPGFFWTRFARPAR